MTREAVGILDTNVVILLPRLRDAAALPERPLITAITLAELGVGPLVARDERDRADRQMQLQLAEANFEPLPFDAQAARSFARVAASLRSAGRKPSARAYDAMIAAIAIARQLPLFTCDPDGYAGIDGLTLVVVPHPDA